MEIMKSLIFETAKALLCPNTRLGGAPVMRVSMMGIQKCGKARYYLELVRCGFVVLVNELSNHKNCTRMSWNAGQMVTKAVLLIPLVPLA